MARSNGRLSCTKCRVGAEGDPTPRIERRAPIALAVVSLIFRGLADLCPSIPGGWTRRTLEGFGARARAMPGA